MEGELQSSPKLDISVDLEDLKYFARLSTILVATLQEVKDRISQIEFIFCSQLFPSFQARSKNWQKTLAESKKAAADEWTMKESSLLRQIEDLQCEKDHALEQTRHVVGSLEEEQKKLKHYEQLLCAHEREKKLLMDKLENVENNPEVLELKEWLRQKTEEAAKGKCLEEKLLQQINSKDQELLAEQQKRREATTQYVKLKNYYKELKSQYEFLLQRSGCTMENKTPSKEEGDRNSTSHQHSREGNLTTNQQSEKSSLGSKSETVLSPKTKEFKSDAGFEKKLVEQRARSIQNVSSDSITKPPSNSSFFSVQKMTVQEKAVTFSGQKRPHSYWRETRAHQGPGGEDPHDDFLDTRMDNARSMMNKGLEEQAKSIPVPKLVGPKFNDSDDETQDVEAAQPQQHDANVRVNACPEEEQSPILVSENKGFKYVEPVRKKAERENLKGFECKQCKKFYDAVLPNGNGYNGNCISCEHHDGVSRHRYKYAPPMTPEGFWNIGFDSEM